MAYRANPFLERMAERTSDQEFVRLFSPKILEKLAEDAFEGAVHMFRSPPAVGKRLCFVHSRHLRFVHFGTLAVHMK